MPPSVPAFEKVLQGPELEKRFERFESFADLLFSDKEPGDSESVVLIGCVGRTEVSLRLADVRAVARALIADFERLGIQPGDTVALLRFPRTSELPLAVATIALSAWGARVFFPMYLDRDLLGGWLKETGTKAVFAGFEELDSSLTHVEDKAWGPVVRSAARDARTKVFCLDRDLALCLRVVEASRRDIAAATQRTERPSLPATGYETPCAVLTTSGSSGRGGRLVVYSQGAFLRSCAAWEQAGLLAPDRLGGRAFCPLLAHSMGVRSLWNALWARQALIFVSPEWFLEHPSRIPGLLLRMRPEHVTGGPAVFTVLLEFARFFPKLTPALFRNLRCLVSSGSAYDAVVARRVEQVFGSRLHNAFGTTETQQVTTTVLDGGGSSPAGSPGPRGSIGQPLPGVRLGLERRSEPDTYALHVRSPFACDGYLGESSPVAGGWWPTGDLVRLEAGALRFVAREGEDFFKDAFGVKIPRRRLDEIYGSFGGVDWVEFAPLREEPGLAALVFMPDAERASRIGRLRARARLRRAVRARLAKLGSEAEDFERRHFSVRRFALIGASAPRTRKGTVSRALIQKEYGAILDSLTGPAASLGSLGAQTKPDQLRDRRTWKGTALEALELGRVLGVRALLEARFLFEAGARGTRR